MGHDSGHAHHEHGQISKRVGCCPRGSLTDRGSRAAQCDYKKNALSMDKALGLSPVILSTPLLSIRPIGRTDCGRAYCFLARFFFAYTARETRPAPRSRIAAGSATETTPFVPPLVAFVVNVVWVPFFLNQPGHR